jgi:hypothetical protein
VIVGATEYKASQTNEGAAFVFLGSPSGIASGNPATAAAQLVSSQNAFCGWSVAGAGDVNGDGYADVIVGAPLYTAFNLDEGAAFVFLGNGNSEGRPVLARQRRGNGSGIAVQPWGSAWSTDGFSVELRASHPAGRGRVKAELQACPPHVAFGHASCTSVTTPTWLGLGGAIPEVLISKAFSGLAPETLYRWRARVLRAPATGPLPSKPAHTPWRRIGAQAVEADVRLLPEPESVLSLASGAAVLVALARRRRR